MITVPADFIGYRLIGLKLKMLNLKLNQLVFNKTDTTQNQRCVQEQTRFLQVRKQRPEIFWLRVWQQTAVKYDSAVPASSLTQHT